MGSLWEGDISFDKVRAVVDVATRETDEELCDQAKERSVRELVEAARDAADRVRVRFCPPSRSNTTAATFASTTGTAPCRSSCPGRNTSRTKACVDSWAAALASDERAPLDQRRCDGFLGIVDVATPDASAGQIGPAMAPNPFFVVAHVPLEALVEESGATSELAGELEHHGLIDVETVHRIACDATVVVAVDDIGGPHHVRGPGAALSYWRPTTRDHSPGPPLPVPGLYQRCFRRRPPHRAVETRRSNRPRQFGPLCKRHHGVVHRKGWSLSGNPNEELSIKVPNGRVMVSRPSPLWARVTADRRSPGCGLKRNS